MAVINVVLFVILLQISFVNIVVCEEYCSTSCGDVRNISYPFRVKGDPEECGDKRYEIDCDNKVPIVSVFSGKYYVKEIDYYNYTIRLVDPGFALYDQPNNCSSLSTPLYFLSYGNFSDYDIDRDPYNTRYSDDTQVVYLRCREAVNDPFYVNVINSSSDDACQNISVAYKYNYVFVGSDGLSAKDLRVGCHMKSVVLVDWKDYHRSIHNYKNVSYSDIHRSLLHGFTISWLQGVCDHYCSNKQSSDLPFYCDRIGSFTPKFECRFDLDLGNVE